VRGKEKVVGTEIGPSDSTKFISLVRRKDKKEQFDD
jgi:hypothetical protein